jgi:outer membrane lipoprotein SlyB
VKPLLGEARSAWETTRDDDDEAHSKLSRMAIAVGATSAEGKGCLTGAAVGGVAGHLAGKHAVAGAAAGSVIGHHEANKNQNDKDQRRQ